MPPTFYSTGFHYVRLCCREHPLETLRAGEFERQIKLLELTEEDKVALNSATEPFLDDWKSNAQSVGLDADKLIAVFTDAVAEYTREYEEKGYPWERN